MTIASDYTLKMATGLEEAVSPWEEKWPRPLIHGTPSFNASQIQAASIDLRLGTEVERPGLFGKHRYDMSKRGTWIWPKEFVLAHTVEYLQLPDNYGALCSGKSTIGRKGLVIENAGWVDPGFEGQLTLELYNQSWEFIHITPYMLICQIILLATDFSVDTPYGQRGRYQGQTGATSARPDIPQ